MASRTWELIAIGKIRVLTDAEKEHLQLLFLRVAENDARIYKNEGPASGGY
jgi:hypothetical protein